MDMRADKFWQYPPMEPIVKIEGRWPFREAFGFTEVFSALFSLIISIENIFLLIRYRNTMNKYPDKMKKRYPYHIFWNVMNAEWVFTMFFSFLFHRKDTYLTERLDYFGALFSIMYMVFAAFIRIFRIESKKIITLIGSSFLCFYLYHEYHMEYTLFDYGYNMKIALCFGLIHSVMWIVWGIKHRKRRPYANTILILQAIFWIVAQLEIWDFPPIFGLFDAHSLWHFGGIFIGNMYQNFLIADGEWVILHGDNDDTALPHNELDVGKFD